MTATLAVKGLNNLSLIFLELFFLGAVCHLHESTSKMFGIALKILNSQLWIVISLWLPLSFEWQKTLFSFWLVSYNFHNCWTLYKRLWHASCSLTLFSKTCLKHRKRVISSAFSNVRRNSSPLNVILYIEAFFPPSVLT